MEISAFLSEKLSAQYGDEAARIFAGFSSQRLTTLRVNRLKTDADTVRRALADAGIEMQTAAWSEDALILLNAKEDAVSALPIFENGEIYMQSLSSMIPPIVLGAKPEEERAGHGGGSRRKDDADCGTDRRTRDDHRLRTQ